MRPRIALLHPDGPPGFPDPETAMRDPDGLLAVGGQLSPEWLLCAYRCGVFPWFNEDDPILWWSPDPRTVLSTDRYRLAARQKRSFRASAWTLTADCAFVEVMQACAEPRRNQAGTWITTNMLDAYRTLHTLGHAHSVEVWDGDSLVGGIYGVAIGRMFFGESMFSRVSGGSKAAMLGLCRVLAAHDWPLIDCQVHNPHLQTLGAASMPRRTFVQRVGELCRLNGGLDWKPAFNGLSLREITQGLGRRDESRD